MTNKRKTPGDNGSPGAAPASEPEAASPPHDSKDEDLEEIYLILKEVDEDLERASENHEEAKEKLEAAARLIT